MSDRCDVVENEVLGKKFFYCRIHKKEAQNLLGCADAAKKPEPQFWGVTWPEAIQAFNGSGSGGGITLTGAVTPATLPPLPSNLNHRSFENQIASCISRYITNVGFYPSQIDVSHALYTLLGSPLMIGGVRISASAKLLGKDIRINGPITLADTLV